MSLSDTQLLVFHMHAYLMYASGFSGRICLELLTLPSTFPSPNRRHLQKYAKCRNGQTAAPKAWKQARSSSKYTVRKYLSSDGPSSKPRVSALNQAPFTGQPCHALPMSKFQPRCHVNRESTMFQRCCVHGKEREIAVRYQAALFIYSLPLDGEESISRTRAAVQRPGKTLVVNLSWKIFRTCKPSRKARPVRDMSVASGCARRRLAGAPAPPDREDCGAEPRCFWQQWWVPPIASLVAGLG